jgi:transketolase N-terminal domain/subunit
MEKLSYIAKTLRQDIFKTAYAGRTGHIAPAFSMVEIVTLLYSKRSQIAVQAANFCMVFGSNNWNFNVINDLTFV